MAPGGDLEPKKPEPAQAPERILDPAGPPIPPDAPPPPEDEPKPSPFEPTPVPGTKPGPTPYPVD
jgi:hypothetical protein